LSKFLSTKNNNKMKAKNFVITLLFFIGMVTVQAQRGGQRGERPDPKVQAKKTVETWQEEFGLSDNQRTRVYDLLITSGEKRTKKMQEMRSSGSMNREAMRSAMTKMQEETDEGLKKIFSSAQWPMYQKWKKENPPRRRGRGRN
jgi:hypothetical protein